MAKRVFLFAIGVAWSATTQSAHAQDLASLLPRLLSESVTMPSTVNLTIPPPTGNPHEAHFLPAVAQLKAPYALNSAIVGQLATFPTGSSSGGFTYTSDEKTGQPLRSSGTFGPSFAERALTIGKGQVSFGLNYQRVSFTSFDGLALDGGTSFYLQHNDCCGAGANVTQPAGNGGNPFFEGDLVRTTLSLNVTTDTMSTFVNYGLSDRADVSLVLPLIRVDIDATMNSEILRLATGSSAATSAIHTFNTPDGRKRSSESGSATGVGDILVRLKYRLVKAASGGLALGIESRLPTGDNENLLGTGTTQVKGTVIFSGQAGKFSPHVNVGYSYNFGRLSRTLGTYELGSDKPATTVTGANSYDLVVNSGASPLSESDFELPDELNYTVGFEVRANPKLTLNGDLLGRSLFSVNQFGAVPKSYSYTTTTGGPVRSFPTTDGIGIINRRTLTLLLGVAGFKLNLTKTLLLNGSVLFPLSSQGLKPKVTAVAGFDVAF